MTDLQILNADFNTLTEEQQDKFYDLSTQKVKEKFKSIIPNGVKTHTLVLENGLGCILRHPRPQILSVALGFLSPVKGNPDMYSAGKHVLDTCWCGGDKEILDNEDFTFTAALQAVQIIEVMQGRVKKN